MRPVRLDLSKGDTRNMSRDASGRLRVRPGFRRVYDPGAATSVTIIKARTIKHPLTEVAWHYLVIKDGGVKVRILDEDLTSIVQEFDTGALDTEAVTISVSNDQVLIGSPDFDTVWGWVGGPVTFARKKASVNAGTNTIEVPRGLGTSFAGRYLVFAGSICHYSDALEPLTFTGQNTLRGPWGSAVYGVHVSAQGMVVAVTEAGLWGLRPEAAGERQLILEGWSKLTDYRALSYNLTAETRGEIWGLTQTGVRRLYPEGDEIRLWEEAAPRTGALTSSSFPYVEVRDIDLRDGRLISLNEGIVAVFDQSATSVFHVVDFGNGFRSWWQSPFSSDVQFNQRRLRDVMTDQRGDELWCFEEGVFALRGNFDGDDGLNDRAATQPAGYMSLRHNSGPGDNTVAREMRFETDSPFTKAFAVNGDKRPVDTRATAPVVGTNTWDTAATYAVRLEMAASQSNERAREMFLEVEAEGCAQRLEAEIELTEKPGRRRPR